MIDLLAVLQSEQGDPADVSFSLQRMADGISLADSPFTVKQYALVWQLIQFIYNIFNLVSFHVGTRFGIHAFLL